MKYLTINKGVIEELAHVIAMKILELKNLFHPQRMREEQKRDGSTK